MYVKIKSSDFCSKCILPAWLAAIEPKVAPGYVSKTIQIDDEDFCIY